MNNEHLALLAAVSALLGKFAPLSMPLNPVEINLLNFLGISSNFENYASEHNASDFTSFTHYITKV